MYIVESKNILTPQNGLNIYRGRTDDSILLTEIPGADPMDIGVKTDAAELLNGVLRSRRNKGIILMGNLGDPYNVHEEEYGLARKALKVIENYDYGVIISTCQSRVLRDIDVLSGISRKTKCVIDVRIPSVDDDKIRRLEGDDAPTYKERIDLIKELRKYMVDVLVTVSPMIPYVNDDEAELTQLVNDLSEYDILGIDLMDMRLAVKKSVRELFYTEYEKRFPEAYAKYAAANELGGELIPERGRETLEKIMALCTEKGMMCDSKVIKSWKRQYENKTVGEQMSLF